MIWLTAFIEILKAFPEMMGVVLELKKMYDEYVDDDKRKALMQQLTEGIKSARVNKDTTQVTTLINNIIAGNHAGK